MKINKFITNNKRLILGIIVGIVMGVGVVYGATILYASSDVSFNNTTAQLGNGNSEISVQDALDSLYDIADTYGCPSGSNKFDKNLNYACTVGKEYTIPAGYTCVRARWVHREKCNLTSASEYCSADGYTQSGSKGTYMVTYGQLGTTGTLATGDAFDCDVNGDGKINVDSEGYSTERFYYVSDYWNQGTNINDFDTNYAVLIYYRNFLNGSPSDSGAAYATKDDIKAAGYSVTSYDNWHGPVTAIKHLPTTNTWSNITLKTTSRTIYSCSDGDCSDILRLTTNGGTIVNPFNYTTDGTTSGTALAGRLLTLPELKKAGCATLSGKTSLRITGGLSACNFLFERTSYADTSTTKSPWLETPSFSYTNAVWVAYAHTRKVDNNLTYSSLSGVRPAIEILKSKISY